jgi:Putative mono-oxygenase ydhR
MPILQTNFKLNVSSGEYQEMCQSLANVFAAVPGLQWKIWLLNEQEKEAGAIYLFNSDEALQDFLSGPIVSELKGHPAFRDISVKLFGVIDGVTAVTRGPVSAAAAAN